MGFAQILVIFQECRINLFKKSAWVKSFFPSQLSATEKYGAASAIFDAENHS